MLISSQLVSEFIEGNTNHPLLVFLFVTIISNAQEYSLIIPLIFKIVQVLLAYYFMLVGFSLQFYLLLENFMHPSSNIFLKIRAVLRIMEPLRPVFVERRVSCGVVSGARTVLHVGGHVPCGRLLLQSGRGGHRDGAGITSGLQQVSHISLICNK